MQTMATNDVFHHLLNLLRIHKEKDLILEMFEAQGIVISKSKLKSWATKSGEYRDGFRPMPLSALKAFIDELYIRKLVQVEGE